MWFDIIPTFMGCLGYVSARMNLFYCLLLIFISYILQYINMEISFLKKIAFDLSLSEGAEGEEVKPFVCIFCPFIQNSCQSALCHITIFLMCTLHFLLISIFLSIQIPHFPLTPLLSCSFIFFSSLMIALTQGLVHCFFLAVDGGCLWVLSFSFGKFLSQHIFFNGNMWDCIY